MKLLIDIPQKYVKLATGLLAVMSTDNNADEDKVEEAISDIENETLELDVDTICKSDDAQGIYVGLTMLAIAKKISDNEKKGKEYKENPVLNKKLVDCDLSVHTLNICHANGLETIGDVLKICKIDWLKFRNGGKRSLYEMEDLLTEHGLSWGMR